MGVVANWLKRFSWVGLVVAVLIGLASMLIVKRRAKKAAAEIETGSGSRWRLPSRFPSCVRRLYVAGRAHAAEPHSEHSPANP